MSRHGDCEAFLGDQMRAFRLGFGEVRQLQEKCDAGPQAILTRLFDGSWRIDEYAETIRLGLIGAGMDTRSAEKLIETWVRNRPALEVIPTAQIILGAFVLGAEDEPVGKPKAARGPAKTKPSQTEKSTLPTSTE